MWLGSLAALDRLPPEIDAVVSLCRVGSDQARVAPENHAGISLVDKDDPAHNPNLDFVLRDAVAAISTLRAEGRTLLALRHEAGSARVRQGL